VALAVVIVAVIVMPFWLVCSIGVSVRRCPGNQLRRQTIKIEVLIAVIGGADRSDKTSAL